MSTKVIDSEKIAEKIMKEVEKNLEIVKKNNIQPQLCAIKANNDPGTAWYAKAQAKHCQKYGIKHCLVDLGENATQEEIQKAIKKANKDPEISAIIVFMPLPKNVDSLKIIETIDPEKDAEGIHPENLGKLMIKGKHELVPCTAAAAVELIKDVKKDLSGIKALVVGRSAIVGKPAAILLLAENATVTVAHTKSNLRDEAINADVIIAAAGASNAKWNNYKKQYELWKNNKQNEKPQIPELDPLINVDIVRRGAIVIDVGENSIPKKIDKETGLPTVNEKGKPEMIYAGDVDFEKVKEVAKYISSPKGGVGPVTNAFLLKNTVMAAIKKIGDK